MSWDQRMINIRNEFDMTELKKWIDTKANKDSVNGDFQNHEFKIGTLDKNIVAIATDFETFQQAINRMHAVVLELQEANKDVLVGKRNLNCLSCGIKDGQSQGIPSTANSTFYGRDGRVYRGGGQGTLEMAEGLAQQSTTQPGSRVASAHHRNNRFSEMQSGIKETFDHLNASMTTGTNAHRGSKSKIIQAPFGIHAEVRKRQA